jgi:hypothetical protein
VHTSRAPEEGTHSPSWPNGLIIITIMKLAKRAYYHYLWPLTYDHHHHHLWPLTYYYALNIIIIIIIIIIILILIIIIYGRYPSPK